MVQDLIEEQKEHLTDGLYVRLCDAMQGVYNHAYALKPGGDGSEEDGDQDGDDDAGQTTGEESESDEEPRERTEDDMGVNELSELWEWQFDFGRRNAVIELEFLIDEITASVEAKRVCAAVRVLNRALHRSKPDDPEDAERILKWKENLVEEGAIKECADILAGDREFSSTDDDDNHWMHSSILCSEILELFTRLGECDALFRTKLRRHGALKGVEEHVKRQPLGAGLPVLEMLRQR